MAWPTGNIITTDLDTDGDSPLNARGDIKQAVDAVNEIIGARGAANGVAPTGVDNKVPATHLPADLAQLTGAQTFTGVKTFAAAISVLAGVVSNQPVTLAQFPTVFATPGRITLPGGLLIQWTGGTFSAAPSAIQNFNFPLTFAVDVYVVLVGDTSINNTGGGKVSASQFYVTSNTTGTGFYMLAIGK